MEAMEIYNACKSVPEEAKKKICAGRLTGMTDINPMWRIKMLTEQFGPCGIGWYYDVAEKWKEQIGDEVVAFVDINLYVKVDNGWSKPIHGTGGSMMAAKEKAGIHVSDECYKMATTDAISVACKQLGIGADVYWCADKTKYSGDTNNNQKNSNAITDKEIKELQDLCKKKGLDVKAVFNTPLEALLNGQYKKAVEQLSALKDKT